MAAKKSFKASMESQAPVSPVMSYISSQTEEAEVKEERKSKRLNLLLKPSVFTAASKIATMQRTSVNDLINRVLLDYIASEAETLEKYNEIFGEEV